MRMPPVQAVFWTNQGGTGCEVRAGTGRSVRCSSGYRNVPPFVITTVLEGTCRPTAASVNGLCVHIGAEYETPLRADEFVSTPEEIA